MKDNGKFQGFEEPKQNWSKLPHVFIDALPMVETIGEMKVILYILRHTWGFQDDRKKITIDEFEKGRKRADGTRMDDGTGLSKPTILNGLERAERHGFIAVEMDSSDRARIKKFYSLSMSNNFIPDVKNLDPCGKETLQRSEKETLETNFIERNNGADAPAQPEPVQEPKPKKKATGKNALKAELIDFFVEATGLPAPLLNNGKQCKAAGATWFSPVLEVAGWCDGDPDECKAIIGAAITRLREINYTISSPKSIINVARAVYAERNGSGKAPDPQLSAAGTYGPVVCAAGLGDVITLDDFTPEELGRCST